MRRQYTDLCENIPEIVISIKKRILKLSGGVWIIGFHFLIGVSSGRNRIGYPMKDSLPIDLDVIWQIKRSISHYAVAL